jgi:hypothetical protein
MDEIKEKLNKCQTLESPYRFGYTISDRVIQTNGLRQDCYMQCMVEIELLKIKEITRINDCTCAKKTYPVFIVVSPDSIFIYLEFDQTIQHSDWYSDREKCKI